MTIAPSRDHVVVQSKLQCQHCEQLCGNIGALVRHVNAAHPRAPTADSAAPTSTRSIAQFLTAQRMVFNENTQRWELLDVPGTEEDECDDAGAESNDVEQDGRKRNHVGGAKHRKKYKAKYKLAVLHALESAEQARQEAGGSAAGTVEQLAAELQVDQSQIIRWRQKR